MRDKENSPSTATADLASLCSEHVKAMPPSHLNKSLLYLLCLCRTEKGVSKISPTPSDEHSHLFSPQSRKFTARLPLPSYPIHKKMPRSKQASLHI